MGRGKGKGKGNSRLSVEEAKQLPENKLRFLINNGGNFSDEELLQFVSDKTPAESPLWDGVLGQSKKPETALALLSLRPLTHRHFDRSLTSYYANQYEYWAKSALHRVSDKDRADMLLNGPDYIQLFSEYVIREIRDCDELIRIVCERSMYTKDVEAQLLPAIDTLTEEQKLLLLNCHYLSTEFLSKLVGTLKGNSFILNQLDNLRNGRHLADKILLESAAAACKDPELLLEFIELDDNYLLIGNSNVRAVLCTQPDLLKQRCLSIPPELRWNEKGGYVRVLLDLLLEAKQLDGALLAELITPCSLPKKHDSLLSPYSILAKVLRDYLPTRVHAAQYAEYYRPYTQTSAVLTALQGLEKIVPESIGDYCAPGCISALADIMKNRPDYNDTADEAMRFLKLLYRTGYRKDEISNYNNYHRAHFDIGDYSCNTHEDTPAIDFIL